MLKRLKVKKIINKKLKEMKKSKYELAKSLK